jgi:hypothetical protein
MICMSVSLILWYNTSLTTKFNLLPTSFERNKIPYAVRKLYLPVHPTYRTIIIIVIMGWVSSVCITNRYGLDGPGIESRFRLDFRILSDRPWGPYSPL